MSPLSSAILAQAQQLAGTDDPALATLCRAAELRFAGRLRTGLSCEDCGEAFLLGAAFWAVADFRELQEGNVAAFSAGDISVTHRQREDCALRRAALALLQPFLEDDTVCFLRV